MADVARDAGFAFIDANFGDLVKPAASQAEFEDAYAERHADCALPIRNTNCLLPGGCIIVGPEADLPKAVAYCATGLSRAGRLGIKTVCFGSGRARACPEGWPMDKAFAQIADFVRALAPVARAAGVKLVIENLRFAETNTLNMLKDIRAVIDDVNDPGVGILVDGYHWACNEDAAEQIIQNGHLIFHTHIATTTNRRAPGEEPCDFSPFANALAKAGYRGDMAVEGGFADKSEPALRKILDVLRTAFGRVSTSLPTT
ncbi:MAG: sugar phosphate isomerase/epimerase family protein [Kiritimatiellia bacterium]|jgi:D-psicose/D-tagatose/L-ribulose 3-epimerase